MNTKKIFFIVALIATGLFFVRGRLNDPRLYRPLVLFDPSTGTSEERPAPALPRCVAACESFFLGIVLTCGLVVFYKAIRRKSANQTDINSNIIAILFLYQILELFFMLIDHYISYKETGFYVPILVKFWADQSNNLILKYSEIILPIFVCMKIFGISKYQKTFVNYICLIINYSIIAISINIQLFRLMGYSVLTRP